MKLKLGARYIAIGVYCGERLCSLDSWKLYLKEFGLIRILKGIGFSIGPILFWHGS